MKTTLTIEEAARLIELGVDAKLASKCDSAMKVCASGRGIIRLSESRPIFTLTDLLSILPKEIGYNDLTYGFNMWVENATYFVEYCAENGIYDYLIDSNISAPELIDVLNQLLIWCLENGHLKTEKK